MIRGRRSAVLLVLLVGLIVPACSGGGPPAMTLDGSPRVFNDQGVVTRVTLDRITLDGKRTYKIDRRVRVFDSTTLKAVPLLTRQGMFVQLSHAGSRLDWLASYTLVVTVPTQAPTSFHTGVLRRPSKSGQAVFEDGSVLDVARGVTIPPAGRQVRADIDVHTHRVRSFTVTG